MLSKSNLYYVFFLLNSVGAGHMAAGRGRSVPPPALDTGEKVGTGEQIFRILHLQFLVHGTQEIRN